MSASIERLSISRKFRGWCEECQDGYQGGKIAVNNWVYLHNENHHEGGTAA